MYISNSESERGPGFGGVYALLFDAKGEIIDYQERLRNTTRNCNGGRTFWNTWVSCEEFTGGRCWQVDPLGKREPNVTVLVEGDGFYEAMACDNRNESNPVFFVTEDHKFGAIRRFRPSPQLVQKKGWDMLHGNGGTIDYLKFLPGNRFTWTESHDEGKLSANTYFRNTEGIDHRNGILYFVAKKSKLLFMLDLDNGNYTTERTGSGLLGNGAFTDGPDGLFSITNELIYFTEDGGRSPGLYARETKTGNYYTIFEAWNETLYRGDETTGVAFSPDFIKLYVCLQEIGYLFEMTRDDGKPFEGTHLNLKHHANTRKNKRL